MATALVTQIAYAVQTLFDPAGTAGRLVDLGKLANYGLLTSFTPAALFTTGVNGAWYDPSDITTLFQDAAGTTPVTAMEQPVGLMLDKSKGLVMGPELVTNGDFSQGTTGWTPAGGSATLAIVSGQLELTCTGAGYGSASATAPLVSVGGGVRMSAYVSPGASIALGDGTTYNKWGTYYAADSGTTKFFSATGAIYLTLLTNSNVAGTKKYYDNISVRELPGNHAFNPSGNSANFPVLSARYNLLTKTEDFSDAVWAKPRVSVNANTVIAPNGTLSADVLTTTSGASDSIAQGVSLPAASFKITVYLKKYDESTSIANIGLYLSSFAAVTARIVSGPGVVSGTTLVTVSQLSTSEWTLIEITTAALPAGSYILYIYPGGGFAAGLSVVAWGADIRVANDSLNQPAYQRVNTATDYDTVGFKPYLSFNGVNQGLQTNSIDFTYGDKMFVAAGVRKLSDATIGSVVSISTAPISSTGTFEIYTPGTNGGDTHFWYSRGTATAGASGPYAAPITNVLSGIGDISGNKSILRVNGTPVSTNYATVQGAVNYGNYPLYIGARAGTSLWFNGRLYGLVVAGKQASASEITNTEAWLNQKTGAY